MAKERGSEEERGSGFPGDDERAITPPSSGALFLVFAGISAVTIGGGYAMVPVIGRALEKRRWLGEEEFYRLFARAQSFPGPLAFTTSLIVGARLAGVGGAAAAGAGVVLPPFAALVLVGAVLGRVGRLPLVAAFLDGAGATVPGLVAAMVYKIARKRSWNPLRVASTVGLALLLSLLPGLVLPLFFAAAAILYALERRCAS